MSDDKKPDQGIIDKMREYMMGHGGLGTTDLKDYDVAMNVDQSSGTAKGYADGGIVTPDLGAVPMPNEPQAPAPAPIQNVLAQSQGLGAQMAGQYTPQMRNQLYAAMLQRQNSTPNAIGGTLAGVGDAIARGYGRDQTNFLDKTQQINKEGIESGLGAFDTAQKTNMAQTQAGMELGKMDPTSAVSKIYQDSYSGPLKKLGYSDAQISKMSASNIEPVAQVGLKYGDIEAQKELKEATLKLTAQMNEAQIANMKSMQIARADELKRQQQETNKGVDVEAAKHWVMHPQLAAAAQARLAAGAGGGQAPVASGPVKVNSAAEYASLPSGTHYVDSYGTEKVKK